MSIAAADIRMDLLPHGPEMRVLDAVLACDGTTLRARSGRHRGVAHPLAAPDATAGVEAPCVSCVHLLEYAAQAAALHIAHAAAGEGAANAGAPAPQRPGVLAFARELNLHRDALHAGDPDVLVEVRRRAPLPGGFAYAFSATLDDATGDGGGTALADGVFAVVLTGAGRAEPGAA